MALEAGETVVCLGCAQAMARPPRARFPTCSNGCAKRERRARHRRERRLICAGCRREFCPTRRDAKFCSDACRFRAYRARLAARAAAAERARDLAQREAERAREATRKAIDLAHALIG
jgi:hypothetical protein